MSAPALPRSAVRRAAAGEGGTATAEVAVCLPALVIVLAVSVWAVQAASAQLRCVDAARLAARAVARGEAVPAARAAAEAAAGERAAVSVEVSGDSVRVRVERRVPAPVRLAAFTVTVAADATSQLEPTPEVAGSLPGGAG